MPLTNQQTEAARLVAEDAETDEQISARFKITDRTLRNWKTLPEFSRAVAEFREAYRKEVLSSGIADMANRVAALNKRWSGLRQIIRERAEDLAGEVAGGGTGLLVRKPLFVKVLEHKATKPTSIADLEDEDFTPTKQTQLVYEYAVDTGLLAELRNHEKQAAQELGQWVDRHDVETRDTTARESLKRKLVSLPVAAGTDAVSGESDGSGE